MADVTSLLGKMRITSNTIDDVATPFQSLPPELLREILKITPQIDRISLSQTCRALRYSPVVEGALLAEPLSRSYLPMGYEQSSDNEPVWGYTDDLLEHSSDIEGPRSKQIQKYLTARQYYYYCSRLNEANGSSVRALAISDFLTIENVQQFARFCPNIRHLDLESFMPPIDSRPWGSLSDPKKVSWEWLTTKCPGIFANVRSIRLGYSGSDSAFDPECLETLAMLLRQAPQLECLEICFTGTFYSDPTQGLRYLIFATPQLSSMLVQCLAENASNSLTELRLDNMLTVYRNLPIFLHKLENSLPNIRKIGTTINKDLQALSWDIADQYDSSTPRTCWQYLHKLKQVVENPRWEFTSLDSRDIYALSPHNLFTNYQSGDGAEMFRFLKERCNWLPVFDWHEQMNGQTVSWRGGRRPLYERTGSERQRQILLIRELFGNLKEAGIPVQLLLSTRPNHPLVRKVPYNNADHGVVDHDICFTKPLDTDSDQSRLPWYLGKVEDLVDQFMIFDPAQDISTTDLGVKLLDHAFVLERVGEKAPENKKTKKSRPTNKRHMGRYRANQGTNGYSRL